MKDLTLNKIIEIKIIIYRFGEVYHGRWHGTDVAVKKFHSWDDASWRREYEVIFYFENKKSCFLT